MVSLRTFFVGLTLLLSLGQANAAGTVNTALHIIFATCTGQLSATMEHQWLFSNPEAERTELHRAAMISLLEASTPSGEAKTTLAHRIDAKLAHSALLTRATFNQDPTDAQWARERAAHIVARCTSMLLS